MDEYKNINTPIKLYYWMRDNISYGYLDKYNRVHYPNELDFNDIWHDIYVVENNNDVLNTKLGNCWDQVEFERKWFKDHGYEVRTIFEMIILDYVNPYPTHSFLIFKDKGKWNWFENADGLNGGIWEYSSIDDLLDDQLNRYISFLKREYNIKDSELESLKVFEFSEPTNHLSADEYLEHVTKSKRLR